MKTLFDAATIIRKSMTKCRKWKFTGSLKNLPEKHVPQRVTMSIRLRMIVAAMMKHRMSRTMTVSKKRMNDSYLTSMFYRLQCIMGSVVLLLKQLSSPKARLDFGW